MSSNDADTPLSPLETIGVTRAQLGECVGVNAEWRLVRKAFFKRALAEHPDKGGDPAAFRELHAAFEALRAAYNRGVASLAEADDVAVKVGSSSVPSHEYYKAAADETIAGYKIEAAPSNKSACVSKHCRESTSAIAKGDIRVGSLNTATGSYGRPFHLGCWRVPVSVWAGLSDDTGVEAVIAALESMVGVTITGFDKLNAEDKVRVAIHVANAEHHAKVTKATAAVAAAGGGLALTRVAEARKTDDVAPPPEAKAATKAATTTVSTRPPAPTKELKLPKPGVDGIASGQLEGKGCVLTGVFDVAGGIGFKRGKDGVKDWLESNGAKVVGSVSKKTAFVVCGNLPGMDKVTKGLAAGAKLTTLKILADGIEANTVDATVQANPVDQAALSFSKGFGNAKRLGGPSLEPPTKRLK